MVLWKDTNVLEDHVAPICRNFTWKIEVAVLLHLLVCYNYTRWHHKPEDVDARLHHGESLNLASLKVIEDYCCGIVIIILINFVYVMLDVEDCYYL